LLVKSGWVKEIQAGYGNEHREVNIGTEQHPRFVWTDEIERYLKDGEIINAINLYVRTKRWGLPFNGGWAEQPYWMLQTIDALEQVEIEHGQRTT
jgi:hypothetical protein